MNEKDAFENAIPLEKSLEAPEEDSEENYELAGMGFNLDKVDAYKKRFNKTSVLHQGYPTNDFLEWYLKACNPEELKLLKEHLDKFRKNQVEKIEKAEVLEVIEQPSDTSIQGYIEKNAELIAEKDTLFKKVQELQEERDKLKEQAQKVVNGIEVMEYNQIEHELLCLMIDIFRENHIKTDKLTYAQIEFINKTYKELSK